MKKQNPGNRILFTGLNTIDMQYLVAHYPETNTKTKAIQHKIYAGGPATNAAITCAFLGGEVDLLTPIGKHTFSQFIIDNIEESGVCIIDPITGQPGYPIVSSIITSQENGERTVFYYQPKVKSEMVFKANQDLKKYKIAMFDGFHPQLSIPIAKICRQLGITTVLDGGSWKQEIRELFYYIDIAICSNDFNAPGSKTPTDIFRYLHEQGVEFIAITRGEKSILYSHQNTTGEIQIDPIGIIDTLGAGDVFHGAFCHYYGLGQNFTGSLHLASKVAGESCKTFGTRQWMIDFTK